MHFEDFGEVDQIGMNRIDNFLWVKVLKLNRSEIENLSALFKQGCI